MFECNWRATKTANVHLQLGEGEVRQGGYMAILWPILATFGYLCPFFLAILAILNFWQFLVVYPNLAHLRQS